MDLKLEHENVGEKINELKVEYNTVKEKAYYWTDRRNFLGREISRLVGRHKLIRELMNNGGVASSPAPVERSVSYSTGSATSTVDVKPKTKVPVLSRRNKPWSAYEDQQLWKLVKSPLRYKEIAAELGRSNNAVGTRISKFSIGRNRKRK